MDIQWLRVNYNYDPLSGKLLNKHGKEVGCYTKRYPEIFIRGKSYKIHRIAVAQMTGGFPDVGLEVDHINGDRHDNRWDNLRVITKNENVFNSEKMRTQHDHGIYYENSTNKWVAQIRFFKKTIKKRFTEKAPAIKYRQELTQLYFKEH